MNVKIYPFVTLDPTSSEQIPPAGAERSEVGDIWLWTIKFAKCYVGTVKKFLHDTYGSFQPSDIPHMGSYMTLSELNWVKGNLWCWQKFDFFKEYNIYSIDITYIVDGDFQKLPNYENWLKQFHCESNIWFFDAKQILKENYFRNWLDCLVHTDYLAVKGCLILSNIIYIELDEVM